jgi:hypothetical protein
MQKLKMKRRAAEKTLKAEGRLQPATIVNFNPFPLIVEAGSLVVATVPARKEGEKYSFVTLTEPRFAFPFKGMISANNGTDLIADYDLISVLPVQQAMEFRKTYMETTQDMSGGVMGGVMVFEGTIDLLDRMADKKFEVRIPYLEILEDGTSLVATKPYRLAQLWDEAQESLRSHCMAKIQQAHSYQSDPAQVKNITSEHRRYANFAIAQGWAMIESLPWLNHSPAPDSLCKKCRKPLVANAYMCGNCNKVTDPVRAYQEGDVSYNDVSFQLLDAAGWKEVKRIKAIRDKAAAE